MMTWIQGMMGNRCGHGIDGQACYSIRLRFPEAISVLTLKRGLQITMTPGHVAQKFLEKLADFSEHYRHLRNCSFFHSLNKYKK